MDLVTNCSSLALHVYHDATTLILEVHVHAMVAHLFCNTVSANNNYTCIILCRLCSEWLLLVRVIKLSMEIYEMMYS